MLKELLKLSTNPVGLKWLREKDAVNGKILSAPATFCQAVRLAALGGHRIYMRSQDVGCRTAQWILGFREPDKEDIEHHRQMYVTNQEEAITLMKSKPHFEPGEIKGIELGPVDNNEWDVVILILNSLQTLRILQAWTFHNPEGLEIHLGSSSLICSFGAIAAYKKKTLVVTLPCIGAKVFGLYQDHDLVCAFHYQWLDKLVEGLKETEKKGHKIPYVPRFAVPPSPPGEIFKN